MLTIQKFIELHTMTNSWGELAQEINKFYGIDIVSSETIRSITLDRLEFGYNPTIDILNKLYKHKKYDKKVYELLND